MGSRQRRELRPFRPERAEQGAGDRALVDALLARDETAYRDLTRELHRSMLRVAELYCPSEAIAQEVVQETWLAVLQGLDRFAFRSSLRTWIFRIVANRARTRATRERRGLSLDKLLADHGDGDLDPSRFHNRGAWAHAPLGFDPEQAVNDARFLERLSCELERLPDKQRAAVTLRDVEGLSTTEAAEAMGLTEVHVRVLLHRGRARLRGRLQAPAAAA